MQSKKDLWQLKLSIIHYKKDAKFWQKLRETHESLKVFIFLTTVLVYP